MSAAAFLYLISWWVGYIFKVIFFLVHDLHYRNQKTFHQVLCFQILLFKLPFLRVFKGNCCYFLVPQTRNTPGLLFKALPAERGVLKDVHKWQCSVSQAALSCWQEHAWKKSVSVATLISKLDMDGQFYSNTPLKSMWLLFPHLLNRQTLNCRMGDSDSQWNGFRW